MQPLHRSLRLLLLPLLALALVACSGNKSSEGASTTYGSEPAATGPMPEPANNLPEPAPTTSTPPPTPSTPPPTNNPPPSSDYRPWTAPSNNPAATQPATRFPKGILVPGKKGYVKSPYAEHAGLVEVVGFPSGTVVKCPFTGKNFIVP